MLFMCESFFVDFLIAVLGEYRVVGQGGFLRGRLRGLREKGPWALFREGPGNFGARKAIFSYLKTEKCLRLKPFERRKLLFKLNVCE